MRAKSITGSSLSLIFCVAGYIAYAYAISNDNRILIILTALIYFFPLFVDFCEDFQSLRIGNANVFWALVVCFAIGIIHLVLLLSCLIIIPANSFQESVSPGIRMLIIILPIASLPIKFYPLGVCIMQLFNRNFGKRRITQYAHKKANNYKKGKVDIK